MTNKKELIIKSIKVAELFIEATNQVVDEFNSNINKEDPYPISFDSHIKLLKSRIELRHWLDHIS